MNVPEFDENAGLPAHKYMKIADHIALRIEAGNLPPSARITEPDLAYEYGVNKLTIRNALRVLRDRGLIRTLAGKGSFVMPKDSYTTPGCADDETSPDTDSEDE